MMEPVGGVLVRVHPLRSLKKKADLVHYDGPLVSLFENSEGEPFIFSWCDVDASSNRWVVLRVSEERLASYLGGGLPLRELFLQPGDGYLFVVDMDDELELRAVRLNYPEDLPESYLPAADSYLLTRPSHVEFDLESLARSYQSPLLDLHLIKGEGVRLGSADIRTLGGILFTSGGLAENVAVSLFATKDGPDQMSREEARAYGKFEYITQKTASFSAILKPVVSQQNLPGFKDRTTQVVEVMLSLLTQTGDYEELKAAANAHNDPVIRSLEGFLNAIKTSSTELEVRWSEPSTEAPPVARIDPALSQKILDNINRLDAEESQGFWAEGTFLGLDLKRRTYRLLSSTGRESTGKFATKIAYPLTHLSFEAAYRVYVTRHTKKLGGRRKPKVEEIIGVIEDQIGSMGI